MKFRVVFPLKVKYFRLVFAMLLALSVVFVNSGQVVRASGLDGPGLPDQARSSAVLRSGQQPIPLKAPIWGCSLFPPNNIWNTRVDNLPLDPHSDQWVNNIGRYTGFHMDFGSGTWDGGPIGIPYNIISGNVQKVPVSFYYPTESDPGPYPIPATALMEYGSDHHILIVDSSTCILYEIYDASYANNAWSGGSGAIWNLNSNALRPDTWTSADAAGLPILPGLVRYDEVQSGKIEHAIRFTAQNTNSYIWPARHLTSNNPLAPQIPPMGARFRLKASFDISGYPAKMQVILQAMKTYGIILADNGSNWYVSGVPDPGWDNQMLHLLDKVTGNDFEAVDSSGLMVNKDSGATKPATVTLSGNAGVPGATLAYTDGTPKTVAADGSGNYSITLPYGWAGTVTPSLTGYTFAPASRSYAATPLTANLAGQNFTAALITYTLSGNAGAPGVTLAYTDGTPKTVIADGSGNYAITVPYGWAGTVTPSLTGYTFTPASRSYAATPLMSNLAGQNFTATLITYTISGSLGANGAGAALSYTGAAPVTANGSGGYSISVPYNWSGVVIPVKPGYSFTPLKRTYSNVLANQTAQNYTTVLNPYTISGSLGVDGVGATLTYTGGSVIADGSGAYSFSVPANWAGVVIPTKPAAIFTPLNRSYAGTPVTGNLTGQDFVAAPNLHVIDDFNGDGKTDLTVFRKSTGFWYIHYLDGTNSNEQWGNAAAGDYPLPGDYNGDGLTDYAVWRRSTGVWYIKYADNSTYSQQWGNYLAGDIPVPGDYNGDGVTDLAVWRPTNGTWYVHYMDGTTTSQQWGNSAAGDVPVPADYNGDGVTEFAVFRKSTGAWYIRFADGTSAARQWGNSAAGDIPVPGDYNGDGVTELAVWRKTTGFWYIKYADDTSSSQQWGSYSAGDLPVFGDFNGDGKTDYAVWRPGNGTWYIKYADATTYTQQWGNVGAGDFPLPH